jgi:predicted transposase YbfD/YdcC
MVLGSVPDPGTGNAQRHSLLDMAVIAPAALVCGAEICVGFAELAADREPLLQEFLSLENGLPSHDTFSRLFWLRDPQAFGRVLDMAFDEDRARNRKDNGPETLSLVRKLALNLLRKARPPNSPSPVRRKRAGWSDGFARTILGQMRWRCKRPAAPFSFRAVLLYSDSP